jgi:hypothetical protein
MKITIMLLLASCVVSFSQTPTDNSALDATQQLLNAAGSNDVETVKSLLNKGVDVNVKDNLGTTALISAVMSGQMDMVKLLLDKGADQRGVDDSFHVDQFRWRCNHQCRASKIDAEQICLQNRRGWNGNVSAGFFARRFAEKIWL